MLREIEKKFTMLETNVKKLVKVERLKRDGTKVKLGLTLFLVGALDEGGRSPFQVGS